MNLADPALWLINGLLASLYTLIDHVHLLVLLPPLVWLAEGSPREQKRWTTTGGLLAILAAFSVPAPIPWIQSLMAWAGAIAVRLDRFNPIALRWRASSGLTLYALAALCYTAFAAHSSQLDPGAWTGVVADGEAAAVVAQGRSFLNTIAIWGLWIILPLGYLGTLVQGALVHPPTSASPATLIHSIRARGLAGSWRSSREE